MMAAEGVLPFANKTKPKHRTLGWLTIRRSRKNKYNLQDARPNCYLHPDDGPLANGVVDEDDIPKLVERLHVSQINCIDIYALLHCRLECVKIKCYF